MVCKNCNKTLSEEDNFCRYCGAQVIVHRLTSKHIFSEFYHSFFSIDSNKPLLTFIDLFKKPEEVIGGYIQGVRKKYIHPFGYFTIAVTITTMFYFVALKFFPENFVGPIEMFQNSEVQKELGKKIQGVVFQYQTLVLFSIIPFLALLSWVVFWNRKKYNYAENLVINLYCYSHISIISIIITSMTIWKSELFGISTFSTFPLLFIYYCYTLKRLYRLTFWQLILKAGLFLILLIPLYLMLIIIGVILLYVSGNLQEFIDAERAKHAISYIVSSAINWTS